VPGTTSRRYGYEKEPDAFALNRDDEESEDSSSSAGQSESSEQTDNFIDDTDDIDLVPLPLNLGKASRSLRDHFAVFVHYLVATVTEPDILSLMSNKSYFESARQAINDSVKSLADEIAPSTWKPPFRYTLEKRPVMTIQYGGELSDHGCDACWQRGKDKYICTTLGVYTLSTQEGLNNINPKSSLELVSEDGVRYTTQRRHILTITLLLPKSFIRQISNSSSEGAVKVELRTFTTPYTIVPSCITRSRIQLTNSTLTAVWMS